VSTEAAKLKAPFPWFGPCELASLAVECEQPEGWRLQAVLTTSTSIQEVYRG